MQQRVQHVYCRVFSSPVCGWQRCFTSGEYETTIFPHSRSCSTAEWACSVLFVSILVCVSVCVCELMVERARQEQRDVPAVFSWVGFHLRASNKPLRFLSRTHHLDLKTRTRVTASLNMLVHKKGWLQSCNDGTILNAHGDTKRLRVHLIAQARIYFQLFCVITLTHRQSVYKYYLDPETRLCNWKECFHQFSTFVSESLETAARLCARIICIHTL